MLEVEEEEEPLALRSGSVDELADLGLTLLLEPTWQYVCQGLTFLQASEAEASLAFLVLLELSLRNMLPVAEACLSSPYGSFQVSTCSSAQCDESLQAEVEEEEVRLTSCPRGPRQCLGPQLPSCWPTNPTL